MAPRALALALVVAAVAAPTVSAKGGPAGPACRPTVAVVLRGPVSQATPTSLTLFVVRASGAAATLAHRDVTVAVAPATRVLGSGTLAAGASVVVRARACKRGGFAGGLVATRVVVPGAADDDAATAPPSADADPAVVNEAGAGPGPVE